MKTKLTKMKLIGIFSLMAPIIGTVVISCSKKNIKKTNNFSLFGEEFKNREDLIIYGLKNSKKITNKNGIVTWVLKNGETKIFDNYNKFKKFILSRLNFIETKTSNIDTSNVFPSDNSLYDKEIIKILASMQNSNNEKISDIYKHYYRGIHNSIHKVKKNAINSYFRYHKVYKYNGISFRSLSEIRMYIASNWKSLVNNNLNIEKKFSIKMPFGNSSDYYSKNDFEKKSEIIKEMISNNAKAILVKNGTTILNNTNTSSFVDLNDINYINISSTNGEKLWIVDTLKGDSANFYGKYFVKAKSNSINDIQNTNNWSKANNTPDNLIKNNRNQKLIGNIFNIINQTISASNSTDNDNMKKINHIFDIKKYQDKIKDIYTNEDKSENYIAKRFVEQMKAISKKMSLNKRHNSAYELSALNLFFRSVAPKNRLDNRTIRKTKDFFEIVANDYQQILETILPASLLMTKTNDIGGEEKISIKKIFNINAPSYNINNSPESPIIKLSESTKFIEGLKIFYNTIKNRITNGGIGTFLSNKNDDIKKIHTLFNGTEKDYDDKYKISDKKNWPYKNNNLVKQILKANDKLANEYIKKSFDYIKKVINNYFSNSLVGIKTIEENKKEFENIKNMFEKINGTKYEGKYKETIIKDIEKTTFLSIKKYKIHSVLVKEKISTKTYQKFSIEIQDTTTEKVNKKITNLINGVTSGLSIIKDISNIINSTGENQAYNVFKGISNITNTISTFTDKMPFINLAFKVISFAADVISEIIGKTSKVKYAFQTSENNSEKFYWDGGIKTTRFWGLHNEEKTTINDMKINMPVKIRESYQNDFKYFNKKEYSDNDKLKKEVLEHFLKHKDKNVLTKNSNIKVQYTFDEENTIKKSTKIKLVEAVFDTLNKENTYINDTIFIINSKVKIVNSKSNDDNVKEAIIVDILKKTKPHIVVQLPKINSNTNVPKEQENENLKSFKLPGKKVFIDSHVKDNDQVNKYIIVNLGELTLKAISSLKYNDKYTIEPKDYKYTLKKALNIIEKSFLTIFDVQTIYTSILEENKNNNFSQLKPLKEYSFIKAKGINGEIKYFLEYNYAFEWLTSKKQYNLNYLFKNEFIYQFRNYNFLNTMELIKFLDKEMEKSLKGEYNE